MPGTHIYKGKFLRTNPDGILENNLSYKNNKKTSKDLKNLSQKEKDEILLKGLLMEAGTIPRDEEIIKQRILIKNPNYVSYEEVKNEEIKDFLTKYGIIPKREEKEEKENNLGGRNLTEEEIKRVENLKTKEEIIEKVKREREENNGKLKNSEYNNEEEEKEGQDKESKETTLSNNPEKVSSQTRKEYEEFINDKSNYIWAKTQLSLALAGGLGVFSFTKLVELVGKNTKAPFINIDWEKIGNSNLNISSAFLAKFIYGDGSSEYFGNNHWVTEKVKKSGFYKDMIMKIKNDIKENPENYTKGKKGYELKNEVFNGGTFGNDFAFSIGGAIYSVNAVLNEEGNILIDLKITDRYDFHYTDNFGSVIKNPGNKAAVYYEANGYGKPFDIIINITEEIFN